MANYNFEFVIDRSEWACGQESWGSLADSHGTYCCLGLLGKACGVSDQDMRNFGYPATDENPEHRKYPLGLNDPSITRPIAAVNDNPDIPQDKRERELKRMFADEGVKVTFRGKLYSSVGKSK